MAGIFSSRCEWCSSPRLRLPPKIQAAGSAAPQPQSSKGGRKRAATHPQIESTACSCSKFLAERAGCHSLVMRLAGAATVSLAPACKRASFELAVLPSPWDACQSIQSHNCARRMHVLDALERRGTVCRGAFTCSSCPSCLEPSTNVTSTMSFWP